MGAQPWLEPEALEGPALSARPELHSALRVSPIGSAMETEVPRAWCRSMLCRYALLQTENSTLVPLAQAQGLL